MKLKQQKEAIILRQKGMSIGKIAKQLSVAKSSVSMWVKEVILTPLQRARLEENKAFCRTELLKSLVERRREARKCWRNEGFKLASNDERFRLLSAIYWGEGKKAGCFSVSNTDLDMLKLVCDCLRIYNWFDKVKFYANYHPSGLSEEAIRFYWKESLGLSDNQFYKFVQAKKRSEKKFNPVIYGVGIISINSTELLEKILGGIDYLRGKQL